MLPIFFSALLLSLGAPAQDPEPSSVLVWYDFEAEDIETGPYTLQVFQGASGRVSLSSVYRYSGQRSVEIRDVAGDGEFAELQGFFTDRWSGRLYIHFAILIAERLESFNVAFAGISHFSMQEHGLGLWLKGKNGVLHQVSGGRDERLLEIEPFTWYVVDVVYDVDRGSYDLAVRTEGREEPLVLLRDQTNAVGIPGSQLRKYSFIGDIPGVDRSNVRFYVDDILVTSDVPVQETPFVAPGRRLLFIDLFALYQARLLRNPRCAPVLGFDDFGLSPADVAELATATPGASLSRLLEEDVAKARELSPFLESRLSAIADWREGCRDPRAALDLFRRAKSKAPEGKIYEMSEVLALAGAERWIEADALFLSIYPLWRDDPRFPALAASIGLARGNLEEAEQWLAEAYEVRPKWLDSPSVRALWSGELGPALATALQTEFPSEWHDLVRTALTVELRFYVLLWQGRFDEARAYSDRMTELHRRMKMPEGRWTERRGDASFYAGDYASALSSYEESFRRREGADSVLLKLSDVHFQLGNLELERFYREKIYGALR